MLKRCAMQAFPRRCRRSACSASRSRAGARGPKTFADGTRFAKERLWHVEIAFAEPQRGPLVIGDGRYLGLGLMAPLQDGSRDALVFAVPQRMPALRLGDRLAFLEAVRRALMALSRGRDGDVPRLFSGHEKTASRRLQDGMSTSSSPPTIATGTAASTA